MQDLIARFKDDLYLLDRKAIFALVYTAIGLSCTFYLKNQESFAAFLHGTLFESFGNFVANPLDNNLPSLSYWVVVVCFFYVVPPMLAIKFLFKERLTEYGLGFGIEKGFWKLYFTVTALMLPLVYWMSLTAGFAAKYPFFKVFNGEPYLSSAFFAWELIYFIQFFGLEFFFRGFIVHSLKPSLGLYSIFAMTVPYCMIHFGKPMPETFSAIAAGIFLGWLSYRNGSIWLGLLLHCTVAFSMDIMALYNKGLLF
jgi:membrane protease YdiL (CAAX protease family)